MLLHIEKNMHKFMWKRYLLTQQGQICAHISLYLIVPLKTEIKSVIKGNRHRYAHFLKIVPTKYFPSQSSCGVVTVF